MPLTNSLIVNQKLVFARIEIAAARKVDAAGKLDEAGSSQDNPIENKLHQHAHLDSAIYQLASAFEYFLLEQSEESPEVDREFLKRGLLKASPWLIDLLAARTNPEFIALQFASENPVIQDESSSHNLIASVTLANECEAEAKKPPIDLLADWSQQLQAIVDQYRASLFEE